MVRERPRVQISLAAPSSPVKIQIHTGHQGVTSSPVTANCYSGGHERHAQTPPTDEAWKRLLSPRFRPRRYPATYGKTEETFSLKTKGPPRGMRLVRIEGARVDARFQAHREEIARLNGPLLEELTEEQVKTLADVHFASILAEDENERIKGFLDEDFDYTHLILREWRQRHERRMPVAPSPALSGGLCRDHEDAQR